MGVGKGLPCCLCSLSNSPAFEALSKQVNLWLLILCSTSNWSCQVPCLQPWLSIHPFDEKEHLRLFLSFIFHSWNLSHNISGFLKGKVCVGGGWSWKWLLSWNVFRMVAVNRFLPQVLSEQFKAFYSFSLQLLQHLYFRSIWELLKSWQGWE